MVGICGGGIEQTSSTEPKNDREEGAMMYDESGQKASYAEEGTTDSQSPMTTATRRLAESIDVVEALSEKLGASLGPVLRPTEPTPDNVAAELRSVGQPSQHVLHLLKSRDRVDRVADRLRSLLERVEV